jgi:hypothetical protein
MAYSIDGENNCGRAPGPNLHIIFMCAQVIDMDCICWFGRCDAGMLCQHLMHRVCLLLSPLLDRLPDLAFELAGIEGN